MFRFIGRRLLVAIPTLFAATSSATACATPSDPKDR
jgi:hypothetical protein